MNPFSGHTDENGTFKKPGSFELVNESYLAPLTFCFHKLYHQIFEDFLVLVVDD